jgi:hypothetical protein
MRKKLVVCIIIALCLFVSASPWEGAAVTAPEGELPGNGRYIATNSFPRNTVVDIVNIETNKSTRVIVASGLDSPGLLAIVSREAAELIGMRAGSVSRIRMTQPTDPVAYARFTESLSSGIPDYDSGNVITGEYYEEFINPAVPTGATPFDAAPTDATPAEALPPVNTSPSFPAIPDTGFPSYVLEPEWSGAKSGTRSARDIEDLPLYIAQEKEIEESEPSPINKPEEIAETEPVKAQEIPEKTAEYFPEDDYEEIAEYYYPEDVYYEDDFFEEPEEIAESVEIFDDYEIDDYEYDYFDGPEEIAESVEIFDDYEIGDYEYDYFDGPEEITDVHPTEYNIVPTDERPPLRPSDIYGIDPESIISGVTRAAEPEKADNPAAKPDSGSRINGLFHGSYYVQLAAYDSAETAESIKNRIDQHKELSVYEPFVYETGDRRYCVLLKPMNQGESAAVLARFKSIGYKEAFVRLAR